MSYRGTEIYFLVLHLIAEALTINIAFDKNVEYCNMLSLTNTLIDGDKITTEAMREECERKAFISIGLGAFYSVHFVIVIPGYGNDKGQLDFFDVIRKGDDTKLCSKFPGKAKSRRAMRVNCSPSNEFSFIVEITSMKNKGLYVNEIEVHTLGLDRPSELPLIYRGCYANFGEVSKIGDNDLKYCRSQCLRDSYTFIGIKGPTICSCGNNLQERDAKSLESCDLKCSDGVSQCGGDGYFSVYIVLPPMPYYMGCLKREFDVSSVFEQFKEMTLTKCIQICDDFRYALLQNGDSCICINDLETKKIDSLDISKCDIKCGGMPLFMCGGVEYASVFSTCKHDSGDFITCTQLFRCLNLHDMYGDCSRTCKRGFLGRHCIGRQLDSDEMDATTVEPRDPTSDMCLVSNPCQHQPNTECIIWEDDVICQCLEGYLRNTTDEECTDIDECEENPCKDNMTTCVNLNGSYSCDCWPGFFKSVDDKCSNYTSQEASSQEHFGILLLILLPIMVFLFSTMMFCFIARRPKSESLSNTSNK